MVPEGESKLSGWNEGSRNSFLYLEHVVVDDWGAVGITDGAGRGGGFASSSD